MRPSRVNQAERLSPCSFGPASLPMPTSHMRVVPSKLEVTSQRPSGEKLMTLMSQPCLSIFQRTCLETVSQRWTLYPAASASSRPSGEKVPAPTCEHVPRSGKDASFCLVCQFQRRPLDFCSRLPVSSHVSRSRLSGEKAPTRTLPTPAVKRPINVPAAQS